ncbi:MAG: glucose-1-phosphate adenylyltransferase subunit GlgD [Ruminococcaceae bacterium]|nr:glucose-1-phosphate adenylyltransferase subunit GlgD [Oscillospiraceae bacterium]
MATAAGLIFSNIHDRNVPELTGKRSMASVPFGGRYRLVDFALSNMVNANITKVGIITHYNYQSLVDHLGTGKDWDLARSTGGLKILPPQITAFDNVGTRTVFSSRLDALMNAYNFVSKSTEEYIVLSDCDIVCNIDLKDVIKFHIENGADITLVTKNVYMTKEMAKNCTIVETDSKGRVTNLVDNPASMEGMLDVCLNIFVLRREYLNRIIVDTLSRGYKSFTKDIIAANKDNMKFMKYEYAGYFATINTLDGYFKSSMDLLCADVRDCIFGVKSRPVYTKVKNSAPAKYMEGASVKNSLIADGCVIEGVVENSILFRGVHVGKDTVIKNCIIMQDSTVGKGVNLNCVIADKNVVIKDGRNLSGHETHPFSLAKGTVI